MKTTRRRKMVIWPHNNDHSVTTIEKWVGGRDIQITTYAWRNRPLDYVVYVHQGGKIFKIEVPNSRELEDYLRKATGEDVSLYFRQTE